jgi:hypothetical protein
MQVAADQGYYVQCDRVDRVLLLAGGGDGEDDPLSAIQLVSWVVPAGASSSSPTCNGFPWTPS